MVGCRPVGGDGVSLLGDAAARHIFATISNSRAAPMHRRDCWGMIILRCDEFPCPVARPGIYRYLLPVGHELPAVRRGRPDVLIRG